MAAPLTVVPEPRRQRRWLATALILAAVAGILLAGPPKGVSPQGWRLLAIFTGTILGLMLRPLPGGAVAVIGVTAVILSGALPIRGALAGYADPTVWLVFVAFLIARGLIKTGLARRIALYFVRAIGQTSLGLSYAMVLSDVVLATIIPSNGARAGGVILPVARSLSELYDSLPGKTSALLGSFLMLSVYHGDVVACAMFLTGQASNVLGAQMAAGIGGVSISWARWLWVALLPALVSLAVVPAFVYWRHRPLITRTPAAAQFARQRLAEMGPLGRSEKIALAVFLGVFGLWVTSGWHQLHTTAVALVGVSALFITGVLDWEDVISERGAWDLFIWYGALVRMGEALNELGVTGYLAQRISGSLAGLPWFPVLLLVLAIYFYSHYGFASLTAHMVAMYAPFLALLIARGAPAPVSAFSLLFFANLDASLTHYGTTPAPMFFATGYVDQLTWWRTGFLVALTHWAIWLAVGFTWWKLIGLW